MDKNKQKKIIFVFDNWFNDKGGRKKVTLSLLNNIKNFNLTIFAIETKTSFFQISNFKEGLLNGINIAPFFTKHDIFLPLKIFFKLGYFLRVEKPNLVVAVGGGTHSDALFVLISKFFLPQIPTVIINHSNPEYFLKKQNLMLRYLTKICFRKTDVVVAVSKELKKHLDEIFFKGKDRCFTIYNGLNLNNIQKKSYEPISHEWFIKKDNPIILSVARLDEQQKDFKNLIKAFNLLIKKIEARLVIVGDGPDKKDLEFLAENLGIKEKIWFAGFQDNPYKFMAKSDIFVLSSKHEALPTVLLEAMASKKPVVGFANKGYLELLKGTRGEQFLVEPKNVELLAQKIEELVIDEKLREKMGEWGLQQAEKYSWEKVADQILNFYQSLS